MKPLIGSHLGAVPSSSLLKFLRTQADAVCFFTSNSSVGSCNARISNTTACGLISRRAPTRNLSITTRQNAPLEASLLNLEFLTKPEKLGFPTLKKLGRPGIITKHGPQDSRTLSRWNSTESEESQWKRWFALGRRTKEKSPPLRPPDLTPLPFLSDASGTTLARLKATNDLKLRCTEFDENGNVVVVDGEFKKQELIAKVCLCGFNTEVADMYIVWAITSRSSKN
jgi:magnesium transporter